MKSKTTKYSVLVSLLAVLTVGIIAIAPNSQAQGGKESANGHGTLLVLNDDGDAVRRQFSFSSFNQYAHRYYRLKLLPL